MSIGLYNFCTEGTLVQQTTAAYLENDLGPARCGPG